VFKGLIFLLAVISLLLAGYYWRLAVSSYSSYSEEQLQAFERELETLKTGEDGATLDDKVVASLARSERTRRVRVRVFAVAGLVLLAAGIALPSFQLRRRRRAPEIPEDAGEAQRLRDFVGPLPRVQPGAQPPLDKYRAAEVLGVRLDASEAVVEAAYAALLKERDPRRRDGLAPDLQKHMDEQLRLLHQAREVMLGKRPA
jgi:hypothetical protein